MSPNGTAFVLNRQGMKSSISSNSKEYSSHQACYCASFRLLSLMGGSVEAEVDKGLIYNRIGKGA